MDTEKENSVEIDLSYLNNRWSVDGHGDVFWVDSNNLPNTSVSASTATNSTYPGPNGSPSWTFTDLSITSPPQAKIQLRGEDADIEINGESVVGMLREIRDRLNILQVSEEMEAEWEELRELREQYEAKLAECREKSQAWTALKQAG